MTVLEALIDIQTKLKAPKDQKASKYRYRNIEDINEAVKPLAAAHGCAVVYSDAIEGGICVSTCELIGGDGTIKATAASYINQHPEYMSIEQSSGAASSYARKYAACGLFAIDSSECDPDRTQDANPPKQDAQQQDDEAARLKNETWRTVKRWAELTGKDATTVFRGLADMPDYAETAEFWGRMNSEFNQAIENAAQ